MIDSVMFSSLSDDWATPQDVFDRLDWFFHFTLDPCADHVNHKCKKYYTKEVNGLIQDWAGEIVFCNPPYGRTATGDWAKKCFEESKKPRTIICLLIPARTDTKWFHKYCSGGSNRIIFIKGRLKFGNGKNSAPFPSMIVIYGLHWLYLDEYDHINKNAIF